MTIVSQEVALRLFFLGVCLDLAGVAMLLPFLDQYLTLLGFDSKRDLGWIMSIYGACQTLALPVAAIIAQRFKGGRRMLMIVSTLGTPLSYLVKLVALHTHSAGLFLFSRVFTGVTRHTMTAGSALMLDLGGSAEERATHVAQFSAAATTGFVIAPTIGGFVYQRFGAVVLAGCSVCCGFCAAGLIFFSTQFISSAQPSSKSDSNSKNKKKTRTDDALVERGQSLSQPRGESNSNNNSSGAGGVAAAILHVFFGPVELRLLALAMLTNSMAYVQSQSFYSSFLRLQHGFDSSFIGVIISSSAALSALSQSAAGRILKSSWTPRQVLIVATWSCFCGATLIALSGLLDSSSAVVVFFVGMILQSTTSGFVDALAKSTLSMFFDNHGGNAIAMSLCYCSDGANRMLMPVFNSFLVGASFGGPEAPMVSAATAAFVAAFFHTLGPTAAVSNEKCASESEHEHEQEEGNEEEQMKRKKEE